MDVFVLTKLRLDLVSVILHELASLLELTSNIVGALRGDAVLNKFFLRGQNDVTELGEVLNDDTGVVIIDEEELSREALVHLVIVHELFEERVDNPQVVSL